ncbi:MAG: tRNA epoxyqueuosine(34) reductase QueG [Leptospira sp.]|nr:tRNA epoxyqueuosine(34) reductase QueG [Leptospira sp.]
MKNRTTNRIKEVCIEAGFDLVGFAKASISPKDREYIRNWREQGRHGNMDWFAKEQSMEIRLDLKHLGFTPVSVICLGMIYRSEKAEAVLAEMKQKVSRYALGTDYHTVIRKKAKPILQYLRSTFPSSNFRQSVDSLPIPEKTIAKQSGIGWMGKNTNLIHPKIGSYFFISTILTDQNWDVTDEPMVDHCGSCRACLDACPTGALFNEYEIDASLCISHHTIEDRRPDFDAHTKLDSWIYGCDVCQEVCPWNFGMAKRQQIETSNDEFLPKGIFDNSYNQGRNLGEMESNVFEETFKDSSIKRIGVETWNRNVRWSKNS